MKYFILVLALLLSSIGWSQGMKFVFRGKIANIDLAKKEGGVSVTILQNGSSVASVNTASSGKYLLRADVDPKVPFEIVFSKPGLVSKRISFDFSKMNEEDSPASEEYEPVESLDIDLFKERPSVDFSFLETEPVGSFKWNDNAMAAKSDAVTANKMRNKIENLLNQGEKNEAKYQAAIQAGQGFYDKKEYESALAKYEEAIAIKPNEQLPADRILELDALIKAEKVRLAGAQQSEDEYQNLITAADNLSKDGQLDKAILKYKEAITKKPEQYPKDQVVLLTAQLEAQKGEKANQAAYDAKIKQADAFFKQNSLHAAKDTYEAALGLKPSEQYPKDKLKEIESKMSALKEKELVKKKYDDAIAAADALYGADNFNDAKAKYQEALTHESSSTYAKERIKMCDAGAASANAEAEKATKIADLLKKGNDDLAVNKFPESKASFTEVLTLDPANQQAIDKLALIEQKIQEAGDLAAQEKKYTDLIKAGDQANTAKKLDDALAKYQEAQGIKSTPEVQEKITAVQQEINKEKALADKEAAYKELIDAAASKMAADDLAGAKADYAAASTIDPAQALPKQKIVEIDKLLLEQEGEAAKVAKYNELVSDAQGLLAGGQLEEAKAKYVEAGQTDPTQAEPKTRIKEIDALIAENLAKADQASKYQAAVDAADHLFEEAKWEEAQAKYREAMGFDSSNPYPGRKVTEIDQKIQERDTAAAQEKEIETLLKDGKRLVGQKNLEGARDKFQQVIALDPSNAEAASQIETINTDLAALKSESEKTEAFNLLKEQGFALADDKKYPEAKQKLQEALSLKDDAAVQAKIADIDKQMNNEVAEAALEDEYNNFISDAQSKEASGDLNDAIAAYQSASSLKPSESLPKNKITELKAQLSNDQAQAQAAAQLDKSYNDLIAKGAGRENTGDLNGAIKAYEDASSVKPAESLPKDKVRDLKAQLASNETEVETNAQYKDAMKRGDQFMTDKNYQSAIIEFKDARSLKPSETEPVAKIAKAEELENERGGVNAQYEKILTVAQTKINEGDLIKAEELVTRAKTLKPTDPRPDGLSAQIKQLKLVQAAYDDNMSKAEAKATAKSYEAAIEFFELAKNAKPSESLPDERIAALNLLIADQSSEAKKDELYRDYMDKGNATEIGKRYKEALTHYQNALSVKPADLTAKTKVSEMQQILDEIANKNVAEIEKKNKFDALIKEADKLFGEKLYVPSAKDKYEEAMALYPENTYASTQRDESIRLGRIKGDEAGQAQYVKLLKVADKYFTEINYDKAKELYERAVSIKNSDPYPKQKLAEIDAILNPVVVASVELEDLGEEFDGSIIDGGFILEQDDAKRTALKKARIEEKTAKIYASEEDMTRLKTAERLETRNEIVRLLSLISVETIDSDDNRIALIEALRLADVERNVIDQNNNTFETAENRATQGTLNQVTREVALAYMVDEAIYLENGAKMDLYQTYQSDQMVELGTAYKDRSYVVDNQLGEYSIMASENVQDDYDDRLEIERKVDAAEDYTALKITDLQGGRYDVIQEQKRQVNDVELAYRTKSEEDALAARANNEELIEVQRSTISHEKEISDLNTVHAFKTDGEIAAVRRKVLDDDTDFAKIRKEATIQLKDIQRDKLEMDRLAFNGETEKVLESQAILNAESAKRNSISIKADAAMVDKVAALERSEQKAYAVTSQGQMSDEDERLNMHQRVGLAELSVQEKAEQDKAQRKKNTQELADLSKTRSKQTQLEEEAQRKKALDAQGKLDNITDTPPKKVKVRNALGDEYPEGVSEESFKQSDEVGLVKTIITRRVVVIDGHADVYIRTQSLNGITYSKNGSPSLSNVWNQETQDPKLERHY